MGVCVLVGVCVVVVAALLGRGVRGRCVGAARLGEGDDEAAWTQLVSLDPEGTAADRQRPRVDGPLLGRPGEARA